MRGSKSHWLCEKSIAGNPGVLDPTANSKPLVRGRGVAAIVVAAVARLAKWFRRWRRFTLLVDNLPLFLFFLSCLRSRGCYRIVRDIAGIEGAVEAGVLALIFVARPFFQLGHGESNHGAEVRRG